MANTRKRKKINRRVVRNSPEPLSKLDVHMITAVDDTKFVACECTRPDADLEYDEWKLEH